MARAAVFLGPGRPFEFHDFPIPSPDAGEILIRVGCATICGSDRHTWHGRRTEPTPCVLGHEIVGSIVAFGADALRRDLKGRPLAEGDRVTWTIAASCGECYYCEHALPQKCSKLFKYGHRAISPGREFSGGFAEYCLLERGTGVVRVPDCIEDAIAAPANCAVATVAAALRVGGSVEGAVVVVVGTGVLGLNACALARHLGAAEVVACDLDAGREEVARAFGATGFALPGNLPERVRPVSAGRGADLALELSGAGSGVATALDSVRIGGRVIIAGTVAPVGTVSIDPHQLLRRMIRIEGVHNYAPRDLVTAIDFLEVACNRFPFERLIGPRIPLGEIDTAFDSPSTACRCVVIPESSRIRLDLPKS